MKFGSLPLEEARGGVAVHSIRKDKLVLKKGTKIGDAEIAALRAAGISEIVVAKLEPGDIGEDEAAQALANAAKGENVRADSAFTGRANLFAETAGVLVVDKAAIDRLNVIDEAITFATLPAFQPVAEGQMIATAKIIPFAVSGTSHAAALKAAQAAGDLVRVAPYRVKKIGVVSTRLPGLAEKVIEKTLKVTRARLAPAGAEIISEQRIEHDAGKLSQSIKETLTAGAELVLIFGASAIADRRDVIPAAIENSGGRIEHFGMPVDPGNLMLIGDVNGTPVLGAPGCARSPKENGFDWVLARLLAGLPVKREEIAGMGVGGLLMEIVTRPQPREEAVIAKKNIAAVVLAAGQSRRMEGRNKLLEDFRGKPLVRRAVEAALGSKASPVIVVTGKDDDAIKRALAGLDVRFANNPDFAEGLSSSLKAGIRAVPEESAGAVICLGDMPNVASVLIDRLIEGFAPERGAMIVAPVRDRQRGNPVLWARRFFPELLKLEGDMGARKLANFYDEGLFEIAADDDGAFSDIDTPEALEAARKAAK
ncbi:MAG: molybdopterin-binding/glycosyltransferase family 2 protein [Xanthobacteraceae bacterium]|nr:molybdopterin-binding/glycosyltransferase family 2 protein [Xanthobacteraceae bacterium]